MISAKSSKFTSTNALPSSFTRNNFACMNKNDLAIRTSSQQMATSKAAQCRYGKCLTVRTRNITVYSSISERLSSYLLSRSRKIYSKSTPLKAVIYFPSNISVAPSARIKITSFVLRIRIFIYTRTYRKKLISNIPQKTSA